MPMGSLSAFGHVMNLLVERQPRSVLDLGAGMGIYGAGVRQWLDGGTGFRPGGTRLVGVEGFPSYINPCWNLYDSILHGKIETIVPLLDGEEQFDAVILGDVIEHFEKSAGEALIPQLDRLLTDSGVLIVVTPAIWMEQDAAYGNELERHRCLWTIDDFRKFGFELLLDGRRDAFGSEMIAAYRARSGSSLSRTTSD